eukprot:12399003-Karenia_brevis.AAC.1
MSDKVRDIWFADAHLEAVLGSCQRSMPSVISGLRCYAAFARACYGRQAELFPPNLATLTAWSTLFQSTGTFTNYLGHVKVACMVTGADVSVFKHPVLARAKKAIDKSAILKPREKMWIQRPLVQQLLQHGAENPQRLHYARLFLFAYAFLLRVPSEAIGTTAGVGSKALTID